MMPEFLTVHRKVRNV